MYLRLTCIILCLGLLHACTTSPTGRSQLALMPESQLNEMGEQAFSTIQKDTPVERDAVTNRYVQCVASAMRSVYSTTFLLSTGSTPGIPRQTGQVWVLGGAPNSEEQPQNILLFVFIWAWTSSPITVSNSIISFS